MGVILLFALPETASAATVYINSVNFPNDIFRSEVKNFDTNNDNRLSDAEIAAVTTISVAGYADITSLEGIAFFTALEELDCYSCGLTEDEGGEYAKIIFIAEAKDPYNGNVYTDRYVLELWKHDEHTWGDWTIAEPASCTKKGLEERRCTECGVKETRETELTAHTEELRDAVEATCMSEGYSGDVYCSVCQGLLHAGSVIPIAAHTPVEMPATEPTCADPGYSAWEKCSYCGITLVERQETAPPTGQHDFEWTIPAVRAYEALSADQKKRIPAATVKKLAQAKKLLAEMEAEAEAEEKAGHKTAEATTKTMAALSDNADPANSDYKTLTLKAKKISKKSIKLQWKKVKGAAGYIIYANKCGKKNQYQQVAEVKGGSKKSFTLKKIQSGKLKKNTYYKMIVAAYKVTKGGESRVIATSKSIHVATTGGKNGNPAKLTLNKKKVTVKVKKTVKLKAKQKVKAGTKIKKHRKISFESSNPKIATVSKKGVITGKKKGKCTVYVYAQNGLSVKVTVTVK